MNLKGDQLENLLSVVSSADSIYKHSLIEKQLWIYLPFNCPYFTLENHCTRTAQSSRGGCSRRVHKIVYLAVKKGTTRDVFYVHIVEDLMKTAKVNAYIMYI